MSDKENRPPVTIIRTSEPNMDLMAKAFINLHYQTLDVKADDKGMKPKDK